MTVSLEFVDTVEKACINAGIDPKHIEPHSDDLRASLKTGQTRFEAPRVFRFLQAIRKTVGTPEIGIRLAKAVPVGEFHIQPIAQALVSCANWRQALMISGRYNRFSQSFARIRLASDTRDAIIRWESPYDHPENCREAIDYIIFGNLRFAQWMSWGDDVPIKSIHFRHKDPGYGDIYTSTFKCPVYFEQDFDAVILLKDAIDKPFPKADAQMLRRLCAKLDAHLHSLDDADSTEIKIDRLFRSRISNEIPGLTAIAEALGQSERQLRRALKDDGRTYREILAKTRRDLCEEMLIEGELTLSEIADRLGYSEQSAFNRAFKDWFGATPKTYARAINIFNTAFDQLAP